MLVKELIEKLKQMDKERKIIIKFALDKEDEIGYVLEPMCVYQLFDDVTVLACEYTTTKEDCDFVGQVDLKEAIKSVYLVDKLKKKLKQDIVELKNLILDEDADILQKNHCSGELCKCEEILKELEG